MEKRVGGSCCIIWGFELSDGKNENREMGGPWSLEDCHSMETTNQKLASAMEGSMEGRCNDQEAGAQVVQTIILSGKLNDKNNNNKYIVAFGGLQLKKNTLQPTKNGRAWGRRGWRRGTNVREW
jgi:hypothetical protein